MRVFGQIVSVFAIALGTGLLVAGSSLNPVVRLDNVGQVVRSLEWSARDAEFYHSLAAGLKGPGAAFLTLGIVGLVVPWVNVLVYRRRATSPGPVTPSNPA